MTAFRSIGIALAGACISLGSACGGPSSSTGDETGPLDEAGFARELARAVCDNLGPCCALNGIPFDREGYRQTLARNERSEAPTYPRETFAFDAEAAGKCVALARQAAQTCQIPDELSANCERVYQGTTPPGEHCIQSNECAAPASGSVSCDTVGMQRICVVSTRRTAGEACTATCAELPSGGEVCTRALADPNAAGARCYTNDALYCQRGTCRPQVAVGAACDSPDACLGGGRCKDGICDPVTELRSSGSAADSEASDFPDAETCGSAG